MILLGALPKLFQKKYRKTVLQRLGIGLPKVAKNVEPVIWIHAVSMGETRAVIPLFHMLSKQYKNATILISNTTDTGHAEAIKNMPRASAHFLLPFDFSWIMRRVVSSYQPDILILVESDFWYNLLHFTKQRGGKVVLVNGKISERSAKRFSKLKFFTKRLFRCIDHLCLQNKNYLERFVSCGIPSSKCTITGNIKFDFSPPIITENQKNQEKETLGITSTDRVVVIGSTHPNEEELLFLQFKTLWEKIPTLKIILVPRHPERFVLVEALLEKMAIPFVVYSKRSQATGTERILLIDAMGLLNHCYQIAEVAIVGGSFVAGIGGHNILEPTFAGIPVLFGYHMEGQPDLVELVLNAHVGYQIPAEAIAETLFKLLQNPSLCQEIRASAAELSSSIRGSTARTFKEIEKYLEILDK